MTLASNNNINKSKSNKISLTINTNVNTTHEGGDKMKSTNHYSDNLECRNNLCTQHYTFYDSASSSTTTPQHSNQSSSSSKAEVATRNRDQRKEGDGFRSISKVQGNKAATTVTAVSATVPWGQHYDYEYYHPNSNGHYQYHCNYEYEYANRPMYSYSPVTTSSKTTRKTDTNCSNSNFEHRDDDRSAWTKKDRKFPSQSTEYYSSNNGWYYEYPHFPPQYQYTQRDEHQHQQDPDQQQVYTPEDHRYYMCPSPPPPPPLYSEYYQSNQYVEDYYPESTMIHHSSSWEEQGYRRNESEKERASKIKNDADGPETPLSLHSEEKKKQKVTHKVTPSSGIAGRKSSLSAKVEINLPSSKTPVTPPITGESKSASTFTASAPFVELQDMDIVCGRGAPTNYHIGNEMFRGLVGNYHTSYFCAKRSEKPTIAMKVLDILQSRGARFVRRQKGGRPPTSSKKINTNSNTNTENAKEDNGSSISSSSSSYWVEVPHKLAYEKVCQALRDGAPQVQRNILLSERTKNHKNLQRQRHHYQYRNEGYYSTNENQESRIRATETKDVPFVEQGKENGLQN